MYTGWFKHVFKYDDSRKTAVPTWRMSMNFFELSIDYDVWSVLLLTENIPNMMVWLWAESCAQYGCFRLTHETGRQILHLFSSTDWILMENNSKRPAHSGLSRGSPENSVSFSFSKQHHNRSALIGKWIREWFGSLYFYFYYQQICFENLLWDSDSCFCFGMFSSMRCFLVCRECSALSMALKWFLHRLEIAG